MNERQLRRRKFNKQELIELAQYVCTQFDMISSNELNIEQLRLSEMFSAIMVAKNVQQQQQRKLLEAQLNELSQISYNQYGNHLRHANERQVDKFIEERKQKLFIRLTAIKNEKQIQLDHMKQKYDLLLGQWKKLTQNNKNLKNQIELLQRQNKKLTEEVAKLKQQNEDLQLKLKRMTGQFTKLTQQIKTIRQLFNLIKTIVTSQFDRTQRCVSEQLKRLIQFYLKNVKSLTQKLLLQEQINRQQKIESDKKEQQLNQTIRQLVQDLSVSIKFYRKQGQGVEIWLRQYRKLKQIRQQRQGSQRLKTGVYPRPAQDSYTSFITQQQQFLKQHFI